MKRTARFLTRCCVFVRIAPTYVIACTLGLEASEFLLNDALINLLDPLLGNVYCTNCSHRNGVPPGREANHHDVHLEIPMRRHSCCRAPLRHDLRTIAQVANHAESVVSGALPR